MLSILSVLLSLTVVPLNIDQERVSQLLVSSSGSSSCSYSKIGPRLSLYFDFVLSISAFISKSSLLRKFSNTSEAISFSSLIFSNVSLAFCCSNLSNSFSNSFTSSATIFF
jgi:hypothetical protein